MAKIVENVNLMVTNKTVSLPAWMWEIIDRKGKRSGFIREELMKLDEFKQGEKNEKAQNR